MCTMISVLVRYFSKVYGLTKYSALLVYPTVRMMLVRVMS